MEEAMHDTTAEWSRDGGRTDAATSLRIESDNPEMLREEIRRTRGRMSDTIEELGDRLNPHRVKADLKRNLHDATIGKAENMARAAAHRVDDTRHSFMDNIRENPIPAAMAGIGLGWLFLSSRKDDDRIERYYEGTYTNREMNPGYYGSMVRPESRRWEGTEYGTSGFGYGMAGNTEHTHDSGFREAARERGEELTHRAGELKDRAMSQGEDLKDKAQDRVTEIAHEARDMVGGVTERAHEMFDSGRERARVRADGLGRQTRYRAERVEDRFDETLRESPLALGAAAVAIGLAVGLSAPSTRRETELMGSTRDRLIDRARDAAHEATDRARHVAERVADDAKETAREAVREEPFG
jgi:ElaB/YqjD/DUF883 family membrane-anchored ribosome-binding protein